MSGEKALQLKDMTLITVSAILLRGAFWRDCSVSRRMRRISVSMAWAIDSARSVSSPLWRWRKA